MKKSFIFMLFAVLFTAKISFAQDDAQMKQWMEFMTPGEMHKMIGDAVGEWTAEIKMWMAPNTEPTTASGTSVTEALLGGRYFKTTHNSNFMGMPMEGIDISGYDNARKVFHSYWIDNFGTGTMYLEGTYDKESKTLTLTGSSFDFAGKPYKVKEVIKHLDKDNQFMEMYMDEGKGEWKSMEIKYTRKK